MRLVTERDFEHFGRRRHFEVERQPDLAHQLLDVAIADVPSVLAKMRGDAVGAGRGGRMRGAHRIGMVAAARIPDRRHMIYIHAKAQMLKSGSAHCPYSSRPSARIAPPTPSPDSSRIAASRASARSASRSRRRVW